MHCLSHLQPPPLFSFGYTQCIYAPIAQACGAKTKIYTKDGCQALPPPSIPKYNAETSVCDNNRVGAIKYSMQDGNMCLTVCDGQSACSQSVYYTTACRCTQLQPYPFIVQPRKRICKISWRLPYLQKCYHYDMRMRMRIQCAMLNSNDVATCTCTPTY